MYLFTKRTRNIIKGIWIVLAILVMVSMVITYSGFTMLARTESPQAIEVSPEDLAPTTASTSVDFGNLSTSSPEIQELLKSIEADVTAQDETRGEPGAIPDSSAPSEPPVPALNFGI